MQCKGNQISNNIRARFNNYVELARALKGEKQSGKSFHITVITFKKKVLSIGINDYNRGSYTRFSNYKVVGEDKYHPNLHSELSAILKLGEFDCSRYEFFNIRIGNNNQISPSYPCSNCMHLLNMTGYKHLYYIDLDGSLQYI